MRRCLLVAVCLAMTSVALGAVNQHWLAAQFDWGAKEGFYVSLEGTPGTDGRCGLADLKLVLAVADGGEWRYMTHTPAWRYGREYTVRARLAADSTALWLDGRQLSQISGKFLPHRGPLVTDMIPGWANAPTEYLIRHRLAGVRVGGLAGRSRVVYVWDGRPVGLYIFEPQNPRKVEMEIERGKDVEILVRFRIERYPELEALSPFVDRYGQCRYAQWEGKVQRDEDLVRAMHEEERRLADWGMPEGYDEYGGWERAGWKERATGYYRVQKRDGVWWLITPKGNPCFYIGLDTVPAVNWEMTPVTGREHLFEWLPSKDGEYAACWGKGVWGNDGGVEYVSLHTPNLIRKYGRDWREQAIRSARLRLHALGFTGAGKWSVLDGESVLPVLSRSGVANLVSHPDIFDAEVRARFREAIRHQVEPRKRDPRVVGWSLGNEWDEIIHPGEVREILRMSAEVPAKQAMVDYALREIYNGRVEEMAKAWKVSAGSVEDLRNGQADPPAEDVEHLRRLYEDRYYEFIYRTVKELDPDHLYLGCWIVPGWGENEWDFRLLAKHCDVVGYDRYGERFMDELLEKVVRESGKPILCGEFSFPVWENGQRGYGLYQAAHAKNDQEAGERYRSWVTDAAKDPQCVGVSWFHYRDQPLTGRGMGNSGCLVDGEHYAFGLVDVTDRLKWQLAAAMREANLSAVRLRLQVRQRETTRDR